MPAMQVNVRRVDFGSVGIEALFRDVERDQEVNLTQLAAGRTRTRRRR